MCVALMSFTNSSQVFLGFQSYAGRYIGFFLFRTIHFSVSCLITLATVLILRRVSLMETTPVSKQPWKVGCSRREAAGRLSGHRAWWPSGRVWPAAGDGEGPQDPGGALAWDRRHAVLWAAGLPLRISPVLTRKWLIFPLLLGCSQLTRGENVRNEIN